MPQRNCLLMKIIISGGGTGGHIYPAIAIADAIKQKWSDAEVKFVGASDRMEMQKVPQAGYEIEGLWISGFQRGSSLKNLLLPFKVISSLWKSFRILRSYKPDVAIGVGGYASGPLLYAASVLNIPTLIQEQNSLPGITNKLLASRVDRICVAFDGLDRFFPKSKIKLTGNPVRNLKLIGNRNDALAHFGLSGERPIVLVVGGSLGSRTLNQGMVANHSEWQKSEVDVIWQIGDFYMSQYEDEPTAKLSNIRPMRFINRMDYAYQVADIVVCRAGALTLSEIAICEKASILVPSPNVSEDHQTQNAMALVDDDAAMMLTDHEFSNQLIGSISALLNDKALKTRFEKQISKWARPNATNDIIDEIKSLIS